MKNILFVLLMILGSQLVLNAIPESEKEIEYVCEYVKASTFNSIKIGKPEIIKVCYPVKSYKPIDYQDPGNNYDEELPQIGPVKDYFPIKLVKKFF